MSPSSTAMWASAAPRILSTAATAGVDGVCIVCVDFLDPQVLKLVQSGLPVVTVDHMFNNRMAIVSDNVKGVQALVNYVFGMGHRGSAASSTASAPPVTESRRASFTRPVAIWGSGAGRICARGAYHDCGSCRADHRRTFGPAQTPHLHFFTDDVSAMGDLAAIVRAGLRVPEDVSVVGYDGIPWQKVMIPSLTTYHQDTEALGYWAADRPVSLIEHPQNHAAGDHPHSGQSAGRRRSGTFNNVIAQSHRLPDHCFHKEETIHETYICDHLWHCA